MASYALKYQMELFGSQVLDNVVPEIGRKTMSRCLLDELPVEFTKEHIGNLKPDYKDNDMRQMIFKWTKDGLIVKIDRKTWRKKTGRE